MITLTKIQHEVFDKLRQQPIKKEEKYYYYKAEPKEINVIIELEKMGLIKLLPGKENKDYYGLTQKALSNIRNIEILKEEVKSEARK